MQEDGAARPRREREVLRPHRVVARGAQGVGLVRVHLGERREVHHGVGAQRLDGPTHGVVVPHVESRVIERVHLVMRRHLGEERARERAPGAGDDEPHPVTSTGRGAVTTSTACHERSSCR